ncbi:MAG TPA: hypothetical protein VFH77_16160 [Streptomyces sp.]|nr:hypothetical protein [Streptomyces sp.]
MAANDGSAAPIYDGLVEAHGDVAAAARQAAAEADRIADQALRISGLAPQPGTDRYPYSPERATAHPAQ